MGRRKKHPKLQIKFENYLSKKLKSGKIYSTNDNLLDVKKSLSEFEISSTQYLFR